MSENEKKGGKDDTSRAFNQQALPTTAFLGGIAFTGLVLVLSFPASFDKQFWIIPAYAYFDVLISVLGCTCVFFVFGSITMQQVAAGMMVDKRRFGDFSVWCFILGSLTFSADLPLLIVAVEPVAALAVGILECILFLVFALVRADVKKSS